MISIFHSTTHYKGFVAVNCEKNSGKRWKRHSATVILDASTQK